MFASIKRKLLVKPKCIQQHVQRPSESLTHVPWCIVDDTCSTGSESRSQSANKDQEPSSYLDLRRQQNLRWAEERLAEGIALASKRETQSQAEEAYQKGLEVVPDHCDLLTAYGDLLANKGEISQALKLLNKALSVDPNAAEAQRYRNAILNHGNTTSNRHVAPNLGDVRNSNDAHEGSKRVRGSKEMPSVADTTDETDRKEEPENANNPKGEQENSDADGCLTGDARMQGKSGDLDCQDDTDKNGETNRDHGDDSSSSESEHRRKRSSRKRKKKRKKDKRKKKRPRRGTDQD